MKKLVTPRKENYTPNSQELKIDDENVLRVARVICCVSVIGCNAEAIANILGTSEKQVEISLSSLEKVGFVRNLDYFDNSWIPHDSFRKICHEVLRGSEESLNHHKDNYRRYFETSIETNEIPSSIYTLIDAWLLCVQKVFSNAWHNGEPFSTAYQKLLDQYRQIQNTVFGELQIQEELLAQFVASSISKLDCSVVVGVARALANSRNPKAEIAELMWIASSHEDFMASSEAIHAASTHWSGQDNATLQRGFLKLKERLEQCCYDTSEDFTHNHFEICATIAGIHIIGFCKEAKELVDAFNIYDRFPLAEICVLLYLLENVNRVDAKKRFDEFSAKTRETDVFPFVERYMKHLGFRVNVKTLENFVFVTQLPLFIGAISNAHGFYNFVWSFIKNSEQVDEYKRNILRF